MRISTHIERAAVLGAGGGCWLLTGLAWAQAPAPAPVPPPAGAAGGEGSATTVVLIALGIVAVLALVLAVRWFDLKRRRDAEAVALQGRLSDALLRDPSLAGIPVVVTVHVPTWRGSPATVDVRGDVPTPEMREAVIRFVSREAAGQRSDCRVEDRLMVLPRTHVAA
jgi:hypothetical protein